MIRYALACEKGHGFEVWFGSSQAYDEQAEANLIICPRCGSLRVRKAPMAPYVAKQRPEPRAIKERGRPRSNTLLRKLRAELTANADFVGPEFREEARKIHYEEASPRGIYGEATLQEAQELNEEGIPVWPLPQLPEDQN